MILERGTLLNNRYRIVEILGQGGMGSVYRAVDENLGVEVAVKDNLFTTDDYARQFRREAIILANLRHPNLPRVTDHFVINGQGQYLVMDYIEGEDLRQRMERVGVIPEEEAITIGAAVCDALTYLASRKPAIIHRDIKPGNVKIAPQGHIYLVDFGLAKTMQSSQVTTTGARAMTPGFSPPEQYGTARTDHRSDIFSLGATLYASLTGATPEDALARAMEQALLTPIRKHNPKISRKLAAAIEKALEIRPDDRYQTPEEFKQALLGASAASHRRNEDYYVTPPPEEEPTIPEDAADLPPLDLGKKSPTPVLAASQAAGGISPSLLPISTPLDEKEQSKPLKRSSARRGRGCLVFLVVTLLLVVGSGIGIYLYYPAQSSLLITQLWQLALSPITTPTTPVTTQIVEPTATPTEIRPSSTFTEIVVASVEPPTPTFTITPVPPTETPAPTETPLPTSTPLGGVGKIAFASKDKSVPQIYTVNTDGTGLFQVTNMSEGACQPSWSSDGARLVFTSPCEGNLSYYAGSSLYIINVDGTGLLPLPTMAGGDFDPAWSPDGKEIVFTSVRNNGRPQIYLLALVDNPNNDVIALSEQYSDDMQPSWSWDGTKIIFITTRRGVAQVWVMDHDGKNQVQFSRSQNLIDSDPSWSPGMQQVIFTQLVASNGIPRVVVANYVFESADYSEYRITRDPIPMREAVFSPDGFWIAFEGWEAGGTHDIYVVAASGAGRQRVTTGPGYEFDVAWYPRFP
jgi:serine/threonine protein kinase/Tol biopolymer transport system component